MRQFFSWRIWAAFAALIGLVLLLKVVLPADAAKPAVEAPTTPNRHVDFISLVYSVAPSPTFAVQDGVVSGSADFIIDGQRTMHVMPGTLGEISCPDMSVVASCAVLADLLGDAVVWFALVPVDSALKVTAPPITAQLDDGIVRLQNGWLVPLGDSVTRACPQETGSLSEFIRRFGPGSTTIIDVAKQSVTMVRCSPDVTANS